MRAPLVPAVTSTSRSCPGTRPFTSAASFVRSSGMPWVTVYPLSPRSIAALAASLIGSGTSKCGWPMLRLTGSFSPLPNSKILRIPDNSMRLVRSASQWSSIDVSRCAAGGDCLVDRNGSIASPFSLYQVQTFKLTERIGDFEIHLHAQAAIQILFDNVVQFLWRHRPVGAEPEIVVRQERLADLLLFRLVQQAKEDPRVAVDHLVVETLGQLKRVRGLLVRVTRVRLVAVSRK